MAECAAAGITQRKITVSDLRINVARFGRGKPLLLIHGWPEFWLVWRQVMLQLGDSYELIAPDLRGCGDTGKPTPEPDATATADRHALDMLGLLDALGLDKAGVIGGDVGAYVMQAMSHRAPQRLNGTLYLCTPYPGIGPRYAQPGHLTEVWYQYFQQLPLAAEATEADWLRQAAAIEDHARAQRVIAIVRTWQFAAYAGRYPDDAAIEQLLSGWPAQAGAPA